MRAAVTMIPFAAVRLTAASAATLLGRYLPGIEGGGDSASAECQGLGVEPIDSLPVRQVPQVDGGLVLGDRVPGGLPR